MYWRFKESIVRIPGNIKFGFINILLWFRVIWKDRNWDHYYIYVILRHKLKLTEKTIRKYGHHVYAEKDADDIKTCILLLDRIIKDDYYDNVFINHEKKWGDIKFGKKDGNFNVYREHTISEEEIEQEKKESFRLHKQVDMLIKQDKDLLFKLMRKHIDSWWD